MAAAAAGRLGMAGDGWGWLGMAGDGWALGLAGMAGDGWRSSADMCRSVPETLAPDADRPGRGDADEADGATDLGDGSLERMLDQCVCVLRPRRRPRCAAGGVRERATCDHGACDVRDVSP